MEAFSRKKTMVRIGAGFCEEVKNQGFVESKKKRTFQPSF